MIRSIAFKEFHTNLISARFTIGFLLCLFLIPFTMLVSINDYRSQVLNYETAREEAESKNEARVYSALRPELVIAPEPLSIFTCGISFNVGNTVKIWLGEKPLLATGQVSSRENPLMDSFFSIDFISIVAIIMSLIALIFTYDACSREREDGTLKLSLSNPVSRSAILLGKASGVLFTLMPIIVFCYILSVIIILFTPQITFSHGEWGRVGFLFLVSILFFSLFIFFGIFISTRFGSSATSLVVCLSLWIVFCFIVPNLSVYIAHSLVKGITREQLNRIIVELDNEFNGKYPYPGIKTFVGENRGYDGYEEVTGSSPEKMQEINDYFLKSEPARIDYADRKWVYQKEYLDKLDRQRKFAERISLISPTEVFQLISSELCRTDVKSHFRFLDMTRRYRDELIMYFRDKNLFSSYKYFTRQEPEEFLTEDEMVNIMSGGVYKTWKEFEAWASQHNWDFGPLAKASLPIKSFIEYPPLEMSDVPRFNWEQAPLGDDMKKVLVKITVMTVCGMVLFFLSFVSFIHYDVR